MWLLPNLSYGGFPYYFLYSLSAIQIQRGTKGYSIKLDLTGGYQGCFFAIRYGRIAGYRDQHFNGGYKSKLYEYRPDGICCMDGADHGALRYSQ